MNAELLINKAIVAAIAAGEEILEVYSTTDFEVVSKEDDTPVTKADKRAHKKIEEILESTKLPILSEEGLHTSFQERKKWEFFWLVDPLDGTKEFIKRNDEFTVNIALISGNEPLAGVVYVPVTRTIYVGVQNIGAFKLVQPDSACTFQLLQEKGTKLPATNTGSEYVIATSRSHKNPQTEQYIARLKNEHANVRIEAVGSALKLARIAEGSLSIYPKIGTTMEWDTAAGHAVLKASGKNIFLHDLKTELVYNKENLANPDFVAV